MQKEVGIAVHGLKTGSAGRSVVFPQPVSQKSPVYCRLAVDTG